MPKGRPPGGAKFGGRVKGTPNKQTVALKEMILAALDAAGGHDYLTAQAEANPIAFMALLGRIIPTQIQGDKENPVEIVIRGAAIECTAKLNRLSQPE